MTSRPAQRGAAPSRYSLAAQAHLVLQVCEACRVKRVLLAGHADGALLALMAAAAASRSATSPMALSVTGHMLSHLS